MFDQGRRTMLRSVVVFIFLVAAGVGPAMGQVASTALEVRDIDVDVTAASASVARDQALTDGERSAYQKLINRIAFPQDVGRLSSAPDAEISALIKDFWITDEKVSPVRYVATLNFTFFRDRVYKHLRDNEATVPTPPAKPTYIVPVYETENGDFLWEPENAWRSALERAAETSLIPIRIPAGDSSDQQLVTLTDAQFGNETALRRLANRYETNSVSVIIAKTSQDDNVSESTSLEVRSVPFQGSKRINPADYPRKEDETEESLLGRAANETILAIEADWRRSATPLDTNAQTIPVTVDVQGLDDWLSIQRRLEASTVVEDLSIVILSRQATLIHLTFIGDIEQLRSTLAVSGLALEDDAGRWRLIRSGRFRSSTTSAR
jgi:hypothetical protein